MVSCAAQPCNTDLIYPLPNQCLTVNVTDSPVPAVRPVCQCTVPPFSYDGQYGPSCVAECPSLTYPVDHVPEIGSAACLPCNVACVYGCSGGSVNDCNYSNPPIALEVGVGVGLSVLIVGIVITVIVVRYMRGKQLKQSELYTRLLDEKDERVRVLEGSWSIDAKDVEILERIGRGSYGDVFRAQWAGKVVAMKRVRHMQCDERGRFPV